MDAYSGLANLEVMAQAARYNRFLLDIIVGFARPGDFIIDFGAGTGRFAMAVAERGFRVTCIEPDSALASQITARGLEVLPDISQIASGEVDYIFSLNVLEHIADDKAAAKVWAEKLKPGGRLLVYVPAFPWLFTSMDRKVGHLRRYTRRVLVDLLTAAQFQVVSARYADSLGVIGHIGLPPPRPGYRGDQRAVATGL